MVDMINPITHILQKASRLKAMMLFFMFLHTVAVKSQTLNIQQDSFQIAVLCPLYLDSAFDTQQNFRFDKNIPSYMAPGMETYWGVMSAIDSLQKIGVPATVHMIDTRSNGNNVEQLIKRDALSNMQAIMGYVTLNESVALAKYGAQKNIPVFNLNLPNDGGIQQNAQYAVLNPTLATHCQKMYQYVRQNYPNADVLYFYKKGMVEERIKTFYQEAHQSTGSKGLKLQTVFIEDSVETNALTDLLDSTKQTICIIGSMESSFSLSLVKQLASLQKTFPNTIVGMPNWEQVDFTKPAYKGAEILFSSALYLRPENKEAQQVQKYYKENYYTRTTDLMYRSFEATIYIMQGLIQKKDQPLLPYLYKKGLSPWGIYALEPIWNKNRTSIDYYENKHVFIYKKIDGLTKSVQ